MLKVQHLASSLVQLHAYNRIKYRISDTVQATQRLAQNMNTCGKPQAKIEYIAIYMQESW